MMSLRCIATAKDLRKGMCLSAASITSGITGCCNVNAKYFDE